MDLTARNARFAAGRSVAGLRINPSGGLMIIGCVDPRVDPTYLYGLELGEAAVIRNVGGRVTPATLRTMVMLGEVGKANQDGRPRGDWNLVILHHTDCGMTDLAAFPDLLADYFDVPAAELAGKAVSDPYESVRVDVEVVQNTVRGSAYFVSGHVYDVDTGRVEVVVPPAALRTE